MIFTVLEITNAGDKIQTAYSHVSACDAKEAADKWLAVCGRRGAQMAFVTATPPEGDVASCEGCRPEVLSKSDFENWVRVQTRDWVSDGELVKAAWKRVM